MRYQGKISNWKDEKGFGFIIPNGGGNQVFVHIKSFDNRRSRPSENAIVTYEVKTDAKGRAQAEKVAFVESKNFSTASSISSTSSENRKGALTFAAVFLFVVTASVALNKLPIEVLWLYLAASIITFLFYAFDKSAAQHGQWRTPESTLHLLALAGGWPGALVAQKWLRHKSKKQSFLIVYWVSVVINCIAFAWLFSAAGSELLRSVFGAL